MASITRFCNVNQITCEEDKEEPETVKEDELKEEDNAKEPLAVALEAIVHEEVEHGISVDGNESNRKGEDVVEVVNGEEVARGCVAEQQEDQVDCQEEELVGQEDMGHEGHQGKPDKIVCSI